MTSPRPSRRTRTRAERNYGPTPETRAKLRPDPILELYRAGVLDQRLAGAAQEIREIYEAVRGRFMSSHMGRLPEHIDGKPVARSNRHPLDGLEPSLRKRYVAAYMPWAGYMGRRGVPTAGVDRVAWLQLVVDAVIDGHDPAELDARYGCPHGTAGGVLRDALGRYRDGAF